MLCLCFYTLVMVLGASKQALAAFSNPREALKMVFGMHSIRVFLNFFGSVNELLPWFRLGSGLCQEF